MKDLEKQKIVSIMKELSNFAFFATIDEDKPQVRPITPKLIMIRQRLYQERLK